MIRDGFSFSVPPAVASYLSPYPDFKLPENMPPGIVDRAGGRQQLEKFAALMRDFAGRISFVDFFHKERDLLQRLVDHFPFDAERIVSWLHNFYGKIA